MIKGHRRRNPVFVVDIKNYFSIPYHRHIRIIDTGKCVISFGMFLLGTGSGNDIPPEDNVHPVGLFLGGKTQPIQQICPGIRHRQVNGFLGAGDDNGFPAVLYQIGQSRGCKSHGVRAVAYDKAIILSVTGLNQPGQFQPVPGVYIGAVQAEGLNHLHLAEFRIFRHIPKQLPGLYPGCQSLVRMPGGYGSPRGYQQYFFHSALHALRPSKLLRHNSFIRNLHIYGYTFQKIKNSARLPAVGGKCCPIS